MKFSVPLKSRKTRSSSRTTMILKYKTPQAVNDFIRRFRKDAIQALRNQWLPPDQEKAHLEALEANVERLREFLLGLIENSKTEPPAPPEDPSETGFRLFPQPKPEGGWTW
jgi:hypothetical protein